MSDPLESLAAQAEHESFFLAALLAGYARSEGVDDVGLSAALGCALGDLAMIRLCRAPRTDPEEFWEDITCIAQRFGMGPERLAMVVKRGRVVLQMQAGTPTDVGFLMAARDREPPPGERGV
jgi:hypothetical protein